MLIEMELREILQGMGVQPTIVLVECNGSGRSLPILIGPYEVAMLERAVLGLTSDRPLTHDLILNVVRGMGGKLHRIIVDKMVTDQENLQGWYHGKLDIELSNRERVWIDSRPSDALVLAMRLKVPIFVEEDVLPQESEEEGPDGSPE